MKNLSLEQDKTSKGYISFVLIGIVFLGFLLATGFINNVNPPPDGTKYIIQSPTPPVSHSTLQLRTLAFISIPPASIPPTSPTPTCAPQNHNYMLIMDKSDSMSQSNKIIDAKNAASYFVDKLSQFPGSKVGLTTFSQQGSLDSPLTTNYTAVKTAIANISLSYYTCLQCGVITANTEIQTHGKLEKNYAIILTDGRANWTTTSPPGSPLNTILGEQAALTAITSAYQTNKITFYTIGLGTQTGGSKVNGPFLTQIATTTGGQYFAGVGNQLNSIYTQIFQSAQQCP